MKKISHRQKTKWTKANKEKELRAAWEEYITLGRDYKKLGTWVPIVPPYQQGLYRRWKVRADVARSPLARRAREVLDIVQVVEESGSGKFQYFDKKTGHFKDRPLGFRKVAKGEWKYAEYLKKFFVLIPYRVSYNSAIVVDYYVLKTPWMFEEERLPRIVSRQFIPNSDTETRLQELRRKLFQSEDMYRLYHIFDWTIDDWPEGDKGRQADKLRHEIADSIEGES